MKSFYNDPEFSYLKYWQGRHYEHAAEVMAIRRLLAKRHFFSAVDIGAGFGRLIPILTQFCDHVTLVEPSLKQRRLALKIKKLKLKISEGTSESTGLPASGCDLVSIIRVLHHLPNPQPTLKEIHRILKPNGLLLLEFANSLNLKSRITSFITGRPISTLPLERRRPANIRRGSIPFVNHHPQTILKALRLCHFEPLRTLSVSNFRSPILKKIVPLPILLILESVSQFLLSSIYFGPSIFILARKVDKPENL